MLGNDSKPVRLWQIGPGPRKGVYPWVGGEGFVACSGELCVDEVTVELGVVGCQGETVDAVQYFYSTILE